MSKLMNRRNFLKLAGLTGAGVALVGCAPAATQAPPAATATTATAKKFKKDVLNIPIWWGPYDVEQIQKLFDTSFTPDTGVKVNFEFIGTDYVPTVLTRLTGNDPYDLITYNADTASQFVSKGALLPLDELITRDKYDLTDIDPKALDQWTHDGKLYGLSNDMGTFHCYFNVDLFKKAGLEVPKPTDDWTWDDLLTYAKKLTVKNGDQITQYGFAALGVNWCWEIWPNLNGGTHIWDEQLKVCTLDDPAVVEAFQFYQDLMYKENVALRPGGVKVGPNELFLAGQVGILLDGTWQTGFLRDKMADVKFTWDVGMPPHKGSTYKIPNFTAGWSIPKVAKDPDASWAALQLYASPKFNEFMTNFAVVPVRFSAVKAAYFFQWPQKPPQGLTADFYARLKEMGASRRHLKFDLGSDISASLSKLDLIYSNEKKPADILPEIAKEINAALKTRPWNS
jgi:multiple sugar transport system substrate-binding protein